jgi:hypothetical protein
MTKEQILKNLEPLFEEAYETGKWFRSNYQGIWFHPDKLKENQAKGYFVWGPVNWKLGYPPEDERGETYVEQFERKRVSDV